MRTRWQKALGPSGRAADRCERLRECRASRLAAHERSQLQWKEAPGLAVAPGSRSADALSAQPRCCSWCANERWRPELGDWPGGPLAGGLDALSSRAVG